jgi:hypothetical protein
MHQVISPAGLALEGDELLLDLHHGLGVAAAIALNIPAGHMGVTHKDIS